MERRQSEKFGNIRWAGELEIALAQKLAEVYYTEWQSGNKTNIAERWAGELGVRHVDPDGRRTKTKINNMITKYESARSMARDANGFHDIVREDGTIVTAHQRLLEECPVWDILDPVLGQKPEEALEDQIVVQSAVDPNENGENEEGNSADSSIKYNETFVPGGDLDSDELDLHSDGVKVGIGSPGVNMNHKSPTIPSKENRKRTSASLIVHMGHTSDSENNEERSDTERKATHQHKRMRQDVSQVVPAAHSNQPLPSPGADNDDTALQAAALGVNLQEMEDVLATASECPGSQESDSDLSLDDIMADADADLLSLGIAVKKDRHQTKLKYDRLQLQYNMARLKEETAEKQKARELEREMLQLRQEELQLRQEELQLNREMLRLKQAGLAFKMGKSVEEVFGPMGK